MRAYLNWIKVKVMSIDRSEKSRLEQSVESGVNTFGLALAELTDEEYQHFLIMLGESEATKSVYH